jgi:hypothetical protein
MRWMLAERFELAPGIAVVLAADPSPDVRVRLVGRHHPLPEPTCLAFARDRSPRVRQALADADWIPTGVLSDQGIHSRMQQQRVSRFSTC